MTTTTTWRTKIASTCVSLLRVPPLLLIDEILRHSFGLGISKKEEIELHNQDVYESVSKTDPTQAHSTHSSSPSSHQMYSETPWSMGLSPIWIWETFWSCLRLPSKLNPSTVLSEMMSSSEQSTTTTLNHEYDMSGRSGSESSATTESEYLIHISLGSTDWTVIHEMFSNDLLRCVEVATCLLLFATMVIIFMLSTEDLIKLYTIIARNLALFISYILSPIPIPISSSNSFNSSSWLVFVDRNLVINIVIRWTLCTFFILSNSWTQPPPNPPNPNSPSQRNESSESEWRSRVSNYLVVPLFFLTGVIHVQPLVFVILVLLFANDTRRNLWRLWEFLITSWDETKRMRHEFGINHLIHVQTGRLRLNSVFKLFWISKATYECLIQCCDQPVTQILKFIMTRGTETLTGVIGITAVISYLANQFGELLLWFLYCGSNSETDSNRFGSISTVLFFILSLQTGLTTLSPEKRLDRLIKNFALLATALLHALHQMVSPILHAYRTIQGLQARAVLLSIIFFIISLSSSIWLVRTNPLSTWSLAVLALAIEFKVKILVSLIITSVLYTSQLIEYPPALQTLTTTLRQLLPKRIIRACTDDISHEDIVFYLKTFANIAEFLTGIFLFTNAIWIFLFESASAIRAIGMSIHVYFNIWCEAKKGWKIFCQRRTAAMKIMSLKDASESQLIEKDDVCAICYEEMENAKVTYCGHLFHAGCLRKWLYLQNVCPLCHELLYSEQQILERQRESTTTQQQTPRPGSTVSGDERDSQQQQLHEDSSSSENEHPNMNHESDDEEPNNDGLVLLL